MKYIKIVNILIIVMLLSTIMVNNVKASSNYYTVNVAFDTVATEVSRIGTPEFNNYININGVRKITDTISVFNFPVNHSINTMTLDSVDGYMWVYIFPFWIDVTNATFEIYMHNTLIVSGYGLGTHTLNLPCPSLGFPIPYEHALNFTLAGAMVLPTMTIDLVDDIMLTIGKYINCGLTKFTIRAALLKLAAKGVAVVAGITAVSYLFGEFADDIYHAIFTTVPAVQPGDTHFHKDDLPQVMGIIHSHFPTEPHITMAIEQAIRLHIDIHGMISIDEVMTIIKHKQEGIVIDIYKETPEILPNNINVHKDQVDDVMKIVDEYFPVEIPIRNIIEQEIHRYINEDIPHEIPIEEVYEYIEKHQGIDIGELPPVFPPFVNEQNLPDVMDLIDEHYPTEIPIRNIIEEAIKDRIIHDYPNEIPFEEVIDIIEREQNIYVPEIPVETPQQHEEYVQELINKVNHTDVFVPIPATPYIFPGIPETPIIPQPPKRPDDKIHTFPFYSIFVDPIAAVMGITLAHLFAAMMFIGCIISIASSWGVIGAILGGFIGTFMTSYFGLTSWLIPLYLVLVFIIYLNIKIRKGSDVR